MTDKVLDATFSNPDANVEDHASPLPSRLPSTSYTCSSCKLSFQNGQQQRIHMKEPWHVENIKRRIASLPPIPFEAFDQNIEKKRDPREASTKINRSSRKEEISDNEEDNEEEQSASPSQCLFCSDIFASDDEGFAMNLEHMLAAHGMFIPHSDTVADLQSLVGYLATEVRVWHECLYCGATKDSTQSIQSHMRDKGHCLLNLDREPELLEFWERVEDNSGVEEEPIQLSSTEMRFASGKVIGSRLGASEKKKQSRKQSLAMKTLPQGSEDAEASLAESLVIAPQISSSQQLTRREEMSIQGISVHQRQALVLAEKKAQRSEAVARRAREWVYAKGANLQEFDQLDGKMKMGRQNHKLMPR